MVQLDLVFCYFVQDLDDSGFCLRTAPAFTVYSGNSGYSSVRLCACTLRARTIASPAPSAKPSRQGIVGLWSSRMREPVLDCADGKQVLPFEGYTRTIVPQLRRRTASPSLLHLCSPSTPACTCTVCPPRVVATVTALIVWCGKWCVELAKQMSIRRVRCAMEAGTKSTPA